MKDYLRRIEIVTDGGPDMMSAREVLLILKRAGLTMHSFTTLRVCDTCKGRAYQDDGPMYASNDCIRRSEKCPDCDERGRPLQSPYEMEWTR